MSDPRFARLKSDPRFRRPRQKHAKLVVDDRFKGIFAHETKKKSSTGRVDKYGRPISASQEKDNLRRFYRLENPEEDSKPSVDYARGEVLLESSDEGEGPGEDSIHADSFDSDDAALDQVSVDSGAEIDLDETNFTHLDVQAAAYATTHPENEERAVEPTRRLAAVNFDWDHVRAIHLFKICSSLLSPTAPVSTKASSGSQQRVTSKRSPGTIGRGRVVSVCVYPSEFGKERMAREEIQGPPPEIFKKTSEGQNIHDVGGEDDYDEDALRKYQLERLRYYYAVITCDSIEAATHLYNELDGTELERSANVFDLSYVPDDMTFDEKSRDEATDDPDPTFKGIDFATDALRHSKVKLTWDEDDRERSQITRRTLTRKEIDNADFRAYLASSESESSDAELAQRKKKSTKPPREKIRALLLAGTHEDLPEGWGCDNDTPGDVDMQITFTPGLSENKGQDETTIETYQRKVRDKRKKRKETKEKIPQEKTDDDKDDFFDIEADKEVIPDINKPSKRPQFKADTQATIPTMSRPEATSEELALLLASDNLNMEPQHFNLKSVLKAEKKSRRKGKLKRGTNEDDKETQADFSIDVKDERFTALHEDPHFALDPTNPHFKKTSSMTALLEERSRRQKELQRDRSQAIPTSSFRTRTEDKGLAGLVESVKRKSSTVATAGSGKRQKLQ